MKRTGVIAVGALVAFVPLGCGELSDGASNGDDIAETTSSIIGGSAPLSVATRRSLGLIDVGGGCSGALMNQDFVLTATHCLNFGNITGTTFSAPRTDAGSDNRSGLYAVQVGTTDITMVELAAGLAGNMWPNVSHPITTSSAASFVGTNITCYGRGNTAYDADGAGVTGFGIWKSLTKTVLDLNSDPMNGEYYRMTAAAGGQQVLSWGDSGANCITAGGQTLAVHSSGNCSNWQGMGQPGDLGCTQSNVIAQLDNSSRATASWREYMTQALTRAGTTFRPLTLVNGWTPAPFTTNLPAATLNSGIVTLRGAIATAGTNTVPFTLPSGMRPSHSAYVPITLCNSVKGRLFIASTGETTVQVEGGTWSSAQCFTSLEGASFAVNNSSFTNLALVNGWANSPFGTRPAAARVINSVVRLEGAISSGTTNVPFTLPAGFRPGAPVYVPIDLCDAKKGRLFIQSNGAVSIQTFGALSDAQCFTSLEGVSFPVDSAGFSILTLKNGWGLTAFGTRDPAVKNDGGIIRFHGAMQTAGTNALAFTLSASMRPATAAYVPVDLCNSQKGRLVIQQNGDVYVQTTSGAWSSAQCFTSLEGAQFGI